MRVSAAVVRLRKVLAAVHQSQDETSEFAQVLQTLQTLARKEAIPIAIVGGMAAIKHGYERLTNDVDVVIAQQHLETVIRVAPKYGIKVIWQDPRGWHKLECEGIRIEVVPEGGTPSRDAPTTIPGPSALGITEGLDYACLEGWVETKLSAGRRQDQADVVQVVKKATSDAIDRIRTHLAKVHLQYGRLFEELVQAAEQEKQQEAERGGLR
jgi:hypothetical protein